MTTPTPTDTKGAELLDDVQAALERYVILPSSDHTSAVALWIAATHAAPAWNTAPRLVIRAPEKRSGKSRLLDIIEALCHRPVMTINASPSAVYRSISASDSDPPTILIDEADTIFGPAANSSHEDLRGLLNAGHQRGRPALRWDASSRTVEHLDTYALAALAGIGRLPDTIEDRAVIIPMRRRAPSESVTPYRIRRDRPALTELGTTLCSWTRNHLDELSNLVPDMPLEDRAADTWEALVAIADQAGGHWPLHARTIAVALTKQQTGDDNDTLAVQLLRNCRTAFAGRDIIRTTELLAELKADAEGPWVAHGPSGLTARTLARILREFGIRSGTHRMPSGVAKGYAANDFTDAWRRYLPGADSDQAPPQLGTPPGIGSKRNNGNNPGQRLTVVTDVSADRDDAAVTKADQAPATHKGISR